MIRRRKAVSLETCVAPFASDGAYTNVRALSATPRAASYDGRFVPFKPPAGASDPFAVRDLRATTVLRWEYAPGSTLFAVWARGNGVGNTFTSKASYWVGR